MSLESLASMLKSRLQKKGVARSVEATLVCEEAEKILGHLFAREILTQVKVVSYVNKALAIKVSSSVISQEIRLRESEIKQRLNEKFGEDLVLLIRFYS
jgi:predicted nucleic acid-binding Zn ribbon protein